MAQVELHFFAEPEPHWEAACGAVYVSGKTWTAALDGLAKRMAERTGSKAGPVQRTSTKWFDPPGGGGLLGKQF